MTLRENEQRKKKYILVPRRNPEYKVKGKKKKRERDRERKKLKTLKILPF